MSSSFCRTTKTTSFCRKYQDLTTQREQDETRQAKEILEYRKRDRARLNAYMHSVCPPPIRPADPFKALRKQNMGEIYKRPPWSASLRRDYDTLIALREKELAVANSGQKYRKQLPQDVYSETQKPDMIVNSAESDEPYLL